MTATDSRRIRLVSDAVVASYIHDISARTGSGATPAPDRASDELEPDARLAAAAGDHL
jgi:hypothetical protein